MEIESRKKLQTKNNIYKLALISFVTVTIWIGFEIYWSFQQSTTPSTLKQQIKPLNPNLDLDLIDSLSTRRHIDIKDLASFQVEFQQQLQQPPTPSPSPSPTSTGSGQLTSPPATGSGQTAI